MTPFQLVGGHPAADLVNTLDWRFGARNPQELLRSYGDLLRFSEQSSILTPHQARLLRRWAGRRRDCGCSGARSSCARRWLIFSTLRSMKPLPRGRPSSKSEQYIHAARVRQQLHWKQGNLEWEWSGNDADLPLWVFVLKRIRSVARGRAASRASVRQSGLPLVVPGYQQEPYPTMVRHEAVRQSHESATIQSPA